MIREDIIRMAKEADLWLTSDERIAAVMRFANLVAAAERNKVAQWMIARSYATGHGDTVEGLLNELDWQVREEERELCAQVCEQFEEDMGHGIPQQCAEAIRARREQ